MNGLKEYLLSRQYRQYSQNPPIQSIFTADPSAHVWQDGRLYVYASRDLDYTPRKADFSTMDRYHVFSTDDLVNWRDEGEILQSMDLSWGIPGFMWAPDAAFKDGSYYFYYPHTSDHPWNDHWKIGVAKSSNPVSNFEDVGFIEGAGGHALIDPCVYIDDDEKAYLYYGGGAKAFQAELHEDMVTLAGTPEKIDSLEDFHEAIWVFKRKGIYYLTYSDNHSGNNRLRYATGPTPLGPWTHKGIYLESVGLETSHGSVVEFNNKWYAFYHTNSLSNINELRNFCFDELHFNEAGEILPVAVTKQGAVRLEISKRKAPSHFAYQTAEDAKCLGCGIKSESHSSFEQVIVDLDLMGSVVKFENVEGFDGGRVSLGFYYSTSESLAKLRLIVNDVDESLINFPYTGGDHTFDGYVNITVPLAPGRANTILLVGGQGAIILEAISSQKL